MAVQNKNVPTNKVDNNQKTATIDTKQPDENSKFLDTFLWLVVFILLGSAVAGNYLLNKFYGDFFDANSLYALLKGVGIVLVIVVAVVVAMFTTSGKKVLNFTKESYVEVRRVVWPTGTEARTTTIMVGVVTCAVALMLWIFDSIFLYGIRFITSL